MCHRRDRKQPAGPRLSALLAALLVVAAPPEAFAEDARPVTIEAPLFEGGEGLSFFLQCARDYEQQRPDVRVNLYGGPRIADKVRIRILEGAPPELTNAYMQYWPLLHAGKLMPMDRWLDGPAWAGDGTWRQTFLPGTLDPYTVDGKTYGIPFIYSVFGVWYNRAMFEAHGWRTPRTWDEFFALCEQIKRSGIAPLAFQGMYPYYADSLIRHTYHQLAGEAAYAAQSRLEPGCFDNPEMIETFRLVQRTALDYFQPGAMGMTHTGAQLEFFQGRTAMVICGTWLKSEMEGNIPDGFRLGMFSYPLPESEHADAAAIYAGTNYYFVFTDSGRPEQAADFLRFMTSRDQALRFASSRELPVAVGGVNETALSGDMTDVAEVIRTAERTFGEPGGVLWRDMNQYWGDAVAKLLTGEVTPLEAAAFLESSAQTVRERAGAPESVRFVYVWKPVLFLAVLAIGVVYVVLVFVRWLRSSSRAVPTADLRRMGFGSLILFLGPAAMVYGVFLVGPALVSFGWSTQRWDGLEPMQSVGLLHFKRLLFESDGFWTALGNNLFIMLVLPAFVIPISLFLAACLSRGLWGSALFRVVFFFPNLLGVAAVLLWQQLYHPTGGLVNRALVAVGFEGFAGFPWLSDQYLYWALVPMSIWGACGFNMILYLAAMSSVPASLYESSELDGASPWRQFVSITLPLIRDVLVISIVFMVIGGMKVFDVIWLLTEQDPTTRTHVVGTKMVSTMFSEYRIGEAAAIAVLMFVMVFIASAATARFMRREVVEF